MRGSGRVISSPVQPEHLPRLVIAIAYHQTAAIVVPLSSERRDIGVHLRAQRLGLRGSRTQPLVLTWALCGSLVFVDETAENGLALDPLPGRVRDGVVGPERAESAVAVWPPSVVVPGVLGQD
jgi:hypothetical protein